MNTELGADLLSRQKSVSGKAEGRHRGSLDQTRLQTHFQASRSQVFVGESYEIIELGS